MGPDMESVTTGEGGRTGTTTCPAVFFLWCFNCGFAEGDVTFGGQGESRTGSGGGVAVFLGFDTVVVVAGPSKAGDIALGAGLDELVSRGVLAADEVEAPIRLIGGGGVAEELLLLLLFVVVFVVGVVCIDVADFRSANGEVVLLAMVPP